MINIKVQLFISFYFEVSQIRNIQQLIFLPALVFILVLYEVILHLVFDVGEHSNNLVKSFLINIPNIAVKFGFYCCGSSSACDQCYFSKVLTRTKNLDKVILSVFILNPYLALSIRNKKQLLSNLSLPYHNLFRIKHF